MSPEFRTPMRLTEERKTYIIGYLLAFVLVCQLIQSFAGEKQQTSYDRIHWMTGHSNKSLTLLSNLFSLVILDEDNRPKNFENYRKSLTETHEQHKQMSVEEKQLLEAIESWARVEGLASVFSLISMMVVMLMYLKLISEISKRIS